MDMRRPRIALMGVRDGERCGDGAGSRRSGRQALAFFGWRRDAHLARGMAAGGRQQACPVVPVAELRDIGVAHWAAKPKL